MISKIRENRGFTLAETLMAVLILLMATSVVAAGLPAAANALQNAVDASHAQVLLSTTMIAIRDELSTAREINTVNGTTIEYKDSKGIRSIISSESDGIYLTKANGYVDDRDPLNPEGADSNASKRLLISKEASTSNMYPFFTNVSNASNPNIVKITGLAVKRGSNIIADLGTPDPTYEIRIISAA